MVKNRCFHFSAVNATYNEPHMFVQLAGCGSLTGSNSVKLSAAAWALFTAHPKAGSKDVVQNGTDLFLVLTGFARNLLPPLIGVRDHTCQLGIIPNSHIL